MYWDQETKSRKPLANSEPPESLGNLDFCKIFILNHGFRLNNDNDGPSSNLTPGMLLRILFQLAFALFPFHVVGYLVLALVEAIASIYYPKVIQQLIRSR